MGRIKGILWDNDGVLVQTEHLFYQANRDLLQRFGIDLTERNFLDWYLTNNQGAWHLLDDHSPERIIRLRAERDQLYTQYLRQHDNVATEGMGALLANLAQYCPMGVVTSSRRDHFQLIHDRLDLLRHFQFVVTEDMVSSSKPSPEPYRLGLQMIGLSADECLVIEDSPRGLQAANAAGVTCIVLRNKMMLDHAFAGAHRVVDSVEQLAQEIEQLM